jgi:hypothetical protein
MSSFILVQLKQDESLLCGFLTERRENWSSDKTFQRCHCKITHIISLNVTEVI